MNPVGGDDGHQLVIVAQVDGDEPGLARRVVGGELGPFDPSLGRGEEQVAVGLIVTSVDHGLDALAVLQRQQVRNGGSPGRARRHRNLVGLEPVHPTEVAEEQQVGMRGGMDEVRDGVGLFEPRSGHPAAAAALEAELVNGHRLHIAGRRHGEDQVVVVDQILDVELARIDLERRPAIDCEFLGDLPELIADRHPHPHIVGEQSLQVGDQAPLLAGLGLELAAAQPGQSRPGPCRGCDWPGASEKSNGSPIRPAAGSAGVLAGSDQRDDLVDGAQGPQQTPPRCGVGPGPRPDGTPSAG